MSAENLKEVLHSSNLIMKPITRALAVGIIGYTCYWIFSEPKQVERIRPNYAEYRRLKGLPEVPIKHPGWCAKELRIIPKDEEKKIRN